ncbi:hypothetical protein EZ456_22120 [Pedobacter psychrodurus]|uniref:Uncharacterized protein n=1 Tax=Pedobacter psychrodurus TaxID=2530456 RepID=A0A4R0PGK6_9SPHI|nr:hypothetical protein [Pedobacter psychrodurus]TCD17949.1 hypothetical protein EZ456_22120 [Pedobacter psychrodurus]
MPASTQYDNDLAITEMIKAINKHMKEIHSVISALDLGITEVKDDGVYRTFNNGDVLKIASGSYKKLQVPSKRIKLF